MTSVVIAREEKLIQLQIKTASLMRLNAVWGLEKKTEPVDLFRAEVEMEEQVQFDTK